MALVMLKSALKGWLHPDTRLKLRTLQHNLNPISAAKRFGLALRQSGNGHHWVPDIYGRSSYKLDDFRDEEPFGTLARDAIDTGRTMLYFDRLHVLYQAVRNVALRLPVGEALTMMEVGVYKGGGSYFLASVADAYAPHRGKLFSVDTFEGHSELDVGHDDGWHLPQNFSQTSFESVSDFLAKWPFVTVLRGRIQDLEKTLAAERFHLIHLDTDLYEPTRYALDHYSNRLASGGIIVLDDYGFKTCPGIKRAVREFMDGKHDRFTMIELPSGQCLLVAN